MKHTVSSPLGLLIILMFASCGGEAVPPADTAQVVGLIQQDARAVAENPNVTNEMALIDMQGRTNADPNRGAIFDGAETNTNQMMMVVEPPAPAPMPAAPMQIEPPMAPQPMRPAPRRPAPMQARKPISMEGTSIKVGNDRSGQRVSPRMSQKITVVLKAGAAAYADITLYAVPAGSARPLMNANTLIGYAKNFDVANGQAQFTRYWNASNTRGMFLGRGMYNIYMTYSYKDVNGRVLGSGARYWGGSAPISIRIQ